VPLIAFRLEKTRRRLGRDMAHPRKVEFFRRKRETIPRKMVGLGGLEPPTSPLSGAFMVLYA